MDTLPGLLYFENKIPSMYDGDLQSVKLLLDWLIEQKTTDTIEQITEEILEILIEDEEYLAVFFRDELTLHPKRTLEFILINVYD